MGCEIGLNLSLYLILKNLPRMQSSTVKKSLLPHPISSKMNYTQETADDQENTTFLTQSKNATFVESRAKKRPSMVLFFTCLSTLVVVIVLTGILAFLGRIHFGNNSKPFDRVNKTLRNCGDNPTAARQRGCVFDEISFTWDHPACYNAKLSNEFRQRFGFRYFADWEGAVEIPSAVVALGERDLKSTWEQHLIHCVYVWRKFHYAYNSGQPIDTYIGSFNHTHHCGEQWIEQVQTPHNISSIKTKILVKYPSCAVSI